MPAQGGGKATAGAAGPPAPKPGMPVGLIIALGAVVLLAVVLVVVLAVLGK